MSWLRASSDSECRSYSYSPHSLRLLFTAHIPRFVLLLQMVWATGDGSQAQTPDQETICYTVLDIISKVVFGFVLVFSGSALDASKGISSEVAAKEVV